jgi:hypothetical protein
MRRSKLARYRRMTPLERFEASYPSRSAQGPEQIKAIKVVTKHHIKNSQKHEAR